MSSNVAVKVDHVSKFFKLPTESTQSLRTTLVNRFKGIKGYKKQEVLRDISFEKLFQKFMYRKKVPSPSMENWCLLLSLEWALIQN